MKTFIIQIENTKNYKIIFKNRRRTDERRSQEASPHRFHRRPGSADFSKKTFFLKIAFSTFQKLTLSSTSC